MTFHRGIAGQLRSMKFVFVAPGEVFSAEEIEKFYNELELKSDEKYFELLLEISKHNRKLENKPKENWKRIQ
jgi:hypothetical protein